MDLKERLGRLDSIAGGTRQPREEIISDLRKRLERVIDPRRRKRDEQRVGPIGEWIRGEEVKTPYGQVFMSQEAYGSGYRHGGMLLDQLLEVPTYPVSLVSPDDCLRDIDFSGALFMDTETTGLAGGTGTYAFLVGVGYFENSRFITQQFFLRDFSEEKAMLWLLSDLASRFRFLITFNGKRFDVPLLETRFILSEMESPLRDLPNYDLLFPSRRIWRGAYEDCRLGTLESRVLDIHRQDDVPSEIIPYLYFDYLRSGDGSQVHRVFYHNRMDVLSLVTLATRIHELIHAPQTASRSGWVEAYALGRLFSREKKAQQAIGCFQNALKVCKDSGEWEILRSLSLALKREKEMEQAVSVWIEMISFDGGHDVFPFEELAKFYEHKKRDFTEALRWVEEASERLPYINPLERAALEHRFQRLRAKIQRAKGEGGRDGKESSLL